MKTPTTKIWLYWNMRRYREKEQNWLPGRVAVAKKADELWLAYTKYKVKEAVNKLGYDIRYRHKVTDYSYRKNVKIKMGKHSYSIFPTKTDDKE